ncbi:MAG: hypothetical protein PHE83_08725 [Opitutaceae bacterium]|nr:hypothetical protein [Opitutaceae bacterium]
MNKPALLVRSLLASAGWLGGIAAARAQTAEQIISKARAYLGDEAALSAVKSVHFVGTMETRQLVPEGSKPLQFAIDIVFQKPYQQRITRSTSTATEITGLDDYDGWQRIQDMTDPSRWQLTLLDPLIIKKLRANTWENLNFFKGLEKRGGSVKVIGPAAIDGAAVVKAAFIHEPGITFYRYFDTATGKLVLTETDQGDRIKEEGEIMVDGLRFPRRVTTASRATDAKGQVVDNPIVITFDKITLNEVFPDSIFAVPSMTPPKSVPGPAR